MILVYAFVEFEEDLTPFVLWGDCRNVHVTDDAIDDQINLKLASAQFEINQHSDTLAGVDGNPALALESLVRWTQLRAVHSIGANRDSDRVIGGLIEIPHNDGMLPCKFPTMLNRIIRKSVQALWKA